MAADTSAGAGALQREIFARMSGAQRIEAAVEMSELAKSVTLSGIRARNPELDETEVQHVWFVLLHGEQVADQVLGVK